jgi:putative FmdB family regulatory protein
MPIYEYHCGACGKDFEAIQKFSDKPLKTCTCGKSGKVARKLSVPSFHLQGGGWYNEGYSGKSDGKPSISAKSESKPAASNGGESSSKGESSAKSESSSKSESSAKSEKSESSSKKKESKASSAAPA